MTRRGNGKADQSGVSEAEAEVDTIQTYIATLRARTLELETAMEVLRDSIPLSVDQFLNPIHPEGRVHVDHIMNEYPEMRYFHLLNQHIIKVPVIPEQYRTPYFEALVNATKKFTFGQARAEALELLAMHLDSLSPKDVVVQAHSLVVEISKISFEGYTQFNGYTHEPRWDDSSITAHVKGLKEKVVKQVAFSLQSFDQAELVDPIKSLRQVMETMFDISAESSLEPRFR